MAPTKHFMGAIYSMHICCLPLKFTGQNRGLIDDLHIGREVREGRAGKGGREGGRRDANRSLPL